VSRHGSPPHRCTRLMLPLQQLSAAAGRSHRPPARARGGPTHHAPSATAGSTPRRPSMGTCAWRGMEEPRPPPVHDDLQKRYSYACEHCGAQFETRQALGGHRASHNGKMGCFSPSRSRQPKPSRHVLPFDLNDPLPEQQE
jgi:hypothetical protein